MLRRCGNLDVGLTKLRSYSDVSKLGVSPLKLICAKPKCSVENPGKKAMLNVYICNELKISTCGVANKEKRLHSE